MNNKQQLLIDRARTLRTCLEEAARDDPRVGAIAEHYRPLFLDIEAGKIIPPWPGRYRNPMFSRDSPFEDRYGPGTKLSQADAEFQSALEDWPSKRWYSMLDDPAEVLRIRETLENPDVYQRCRTVLRRLRMKLGWLRVYLPIRIKEWFGGFFD